MVFTGYIRQAGAMMTDKRGPEQKAALLPQYHDDDDSEDEVLHSAPAVKTRSNARESPITGTPDDSMCYSIFVTLCCCMPLGLAAMILNILSREAVSFGENSRAHARARDARKLANMGLCVGGVVLFVLVSSWVCTGYFTYQLINNMQQQQTMAVQRQLSGGNGGTDLMKMMLPPCKEGQEGPGCRPAGEKGGMAGIMEEMKGKMKEHGGHEGNEAGHDMMGMMGGHGHGGEGHGDENDGDHDVIGHEQQVPGSNH